MLRCTQEGAEGVYCATFAVDDGVEYGLGGGAQKYENGVEQPMVAIC